MSQYVVMQMHGDTMTTAVYGPFRSYEKATELFEKWLDEDSGEVGIVAFSVHRCKHPKEFERMSDSETTA